MAKLNIEDKIKAMREAGLSTADIETYLKGLYTANPEKPVNTAKSILTHTTTDFRGSIRRAAEHFKGEPKEPVSIAVPYGKMVGGFVKIAINGIPLQLPADGKTYHVPTSFAEAIRNRLASLDAMDSELGFQIHSDEASAGFNKAGLAVGDKKIN